MCCYNCNEFSRYLILGQAPRNMWQKCKDTCSQQRLPCQTLSPASHSYGPTSFQYYCQVAVCCLVEQKTDPSFISAFKWITFAVFEFSWPLPVSSSMIVCHYPVWRLCSWSTSLLLCCNALQLVGQFALLLCFTASGPICFVAMLYSLWTNLLCCYALQLVGQFALLLCFTASGPICFVAMLYSLWTNLLCCYALQLVGQFALLLCFTASGPICFVAMLYSLWANLLCCYALQLVGQCFTASGPICFVAMLYSLWTNLLCCYALQLVGQFALLLCFTACGPICFVAMLYS